MPRYSVATSKASGAAAAWVLELRSSTSRDLRVWEVGVFSESAVAGTVGLVRSSSAGTTPGGAVVPQLDDGGVTAAASANLYTTYGTAPTVNAVPMRRAALPASVGAGIIWTFPEGLIVPTATLSTATNALVLWQYSALAVTYSVYIAYDE